MKRIISFSLWGKNPLYFKGALENCKLQSLIYPDWKIRIYHDDTVPAEYIEELKLNGAETIQMPRSDGNYGMFWRFLPLDDDTLERFIVRDTDSRLNLREAQAVKEWIESEKEFHLMRDNKWHNVVPICGGMWGATDKFIKRFDYQKNLDQWLKANQYRIFSHPRGKYFFIDQSFLADRIWPLIVNKHIAHESVPSSYPGDKRNFIIENLDKSFVGQPIEI